jgi:ABC-type transport system substrate-binding protein/predicted Ser/Thr protein kinase
MQPPVRTGTLLAGFRVDSLIGEGAMGTVYAAEETRSGHRVALKLLSPELARDERFRRRFLRETELAASLDHPHIVRTLRSGEDDGMLYLAMEYVEGSDLREVLRREGRLDSERALQLVGQVAEALDAAHAAGLVHRDVKPGNILVTQTSEGEQAYVCDFGLARHVSSVSSLTGDRGFVGTIDYVPPEQIEGGSIDGRADVYSLGCVLFECLAGARPFDRDSELSVVFAHLNEPPPRLSDRRPDLPEAFDEVFATALAKSPDRRYSTCGELIAAARAGVLGKRFVRRKRRRQALLATVALLLAAGGAIGALVAAQGNGGNRATRVLPLRPNALSLIDARTRRVVAHVGLGKTVSFANVGPRIAFSSDSAWVALFGEQRVVRVDLRTRKVTSSAKLPWSPAGLAAGAGSVWVTEDNGPGVARVDAATGKVVRTFSVGEAGGGGVAYGDGSLWLAAGPGIVRVDPRNDRILERISTPGQPGATRSLVFADGSLWAARADNGLVMKIDPVENRISDTATLHGWIGDLAVGDGLVWAPVVEDGAIYKLSEDDLGVQGVVTAGSDPERISVGNGRVWVANAAAKAISLVDVHTDARERLPARAEPTTAVYHRGLVWAAAAPKPAALPPISGQELRISTPSPSYEPDPAHAGPSNEQYLYATCANLLNYPDSAGPDGAKLRPEIAAAMPSVSNGGRTYTFRIRRGFRFSPPSNEPVTAQTFRHTIERTLAPSQQHGWAFGSDIAGATAFSAGKSAHISGISARGTTLRITLVRPAGDFLTRISMFNFCPVPRSEPVHPKGPTIASPGPYYVASSTNDRTVLLRNPNYHGRRPRRSARIVYTSYTRTPQAVALTDKGTIDYLPGDFDNFSLLTPGGVLDQRDGPRSAAARNGRQRYFREPLPLLDGLAFNTKQPLFRDARLRRAVNYALDRRALARAFYDDPADQIIPTGVPGHRARPFYPLDGPDLATARLLAGNRRRRGVLYACPPQPRVTQIVRSNLARIGIAVSILESERCLQGHDPQSDRADLRLSGLVLGPADRDPAPFFDMAIAGAYDYPPPGPGPWNTRSFRGRVEHARSLRGDARIAGYAGLQRELMRNAPLAVYGNFVSTEYFSPKVGCKLFQAEYRVVDLGALCKNS